METIINYIPNKMKYDSVMTEKTKIFRDKNNLMWLSGYRIFKDFNMFVISTPLLLISLSYQLQPEVH
jgi:hypothetical protein